MKSISLASLVVAAVLSVQTLVEAGSYTVNACQLSNSVTAWDSDGSQGVMIWNSGKIVKIWVGSTAASLMTTQVNWADKSATITYKGKTLSWKSPNDEIMWRGSECLQYWGSY